MSVKQDEVERITLICAWIETKVKSLPLHVREARRS